MKHYVRWAVARDLEALVEIDRHAWGECAWSQSDFIQAMRHRNCIIEVAEVADVSQVEPVGLLVRMIERTGYTVINLAVLPKFRRHGIATTMAHYLKSKISEGKKTYCDFHVREGALDGQLFLKSQGIIAVGTDRGYYDDTGEDAIIFRMERQGAACLSSR